MTLTSLQMRYWQSMAGFVVIETWAATNGDRLCQHAQRWFAAVSHFTCGASVNWKEPRVVTKVEFVNYAIRYFSAIYNINLRIA